MGRGNRKAIKETVVVRPSKGGLFPLVWPRILGDSPLSGGKNTSFFSDYFITKEPTTAPSARPKGPILKDGDGEDNPDAVRMDDISLGQVGRDTQGLSFQLLKAEGVPPERVLLRCLETEDIFWQAVAPRSAPTVHADSVSYRSLDKETLINIGANLGISEEKDIAEETVWQMKKEGLFDMQVQERGAIHTLIGNWYLKEVPDGRSRIKREYAKSFRVAHIARQLVEGRARVVELMPAAEDFRARMLADALPAPLDKTDEIREDICRALLKDIPLQAAIDELEAISGQHTSNEEIQRKVSDLLRDLEGFRESLPDFDDQFFVPRVLPVWRRAINLRVD